MEMLVQLGVNKTYFIQFGVFVFTVYILSQFVFKDFVVLLDSRDHETKGTEAISSEEHQKAAELQKSYEARARAVSGDIKTIFDNYRQEAGSEYEKIVSKARAESARLAEESRRKVAVEIGDAARKLKEEAPLVAQAMTAKLLAKDANGRQA